MCLLLEMHQSTGWVLEWADFADWWLAFQSHVKFSYKTFHFMHAQHKHSGESK